MWQSVHAFILFKMVQHKAISDGKTHYSQNFKDQVIEALVTDTQTNVL